jgi:FkbH-like protein
MVFNIDTLPVLALNIHSIIQAISGRFTKCIILDLDNTLWGGVIGDDGMEGIQIGELGTGKAYTELQRWFKQLKNRGILLVVCSKNTEAIAKEPFELHPDMELRLDDFALFIANWENKADNIRHIREVLQIGLDSMVLIDDNPFEREMVRTALPELTIPDLPEDPADYLTYLRSLNLFETGSRTEEDSVRTRQYQEEAKRVSFKKSFSGEADFLASLNMHAGVDSFTGFTIPRVAQLSQRSNQFNLRTVRYTESDIQKIAASGEYFTFSFTLKDKFGDHGLICALILHKTDNETLFIDTWIMSCRVLKRGVEQFVLNTIVDFARNGRFKNITGQYIATAKNSIVKSLYPDLGFTASDELFVMEVTNYIPRESFIKPIS